MVVDTTSEDKLTLIIFLKLLGITGVVYHYIWLTVIICDGCTINDDMLVDRYMKQVLLTDIIRQTLLWLLLKMKHKKEMVGNHI